MWRSEGQLRRVFEGREEVSVWLVQYGGPLYPTPALSHVQPLHQPLASPRQHKRQVHQPSNHWGGSHVLYRTHSVFLWHLISFRAHMAEIYLRDHVQSADHSPKIFECWMPQLTNQSKVFQGSVKLYVFVGVCVCVCIYIYIYIYIYQLYTVYYKYLYI